MTYLGKCEHIKYETWSSYRCHRDAVEEYDGRKLCKPHVAGAKRSAKAAEKAKERTAAEDFARDESKRRAANINALEPSLSAQPVYVWHRSIYDTELVEVKYDALFDLIHRPGVR